MFITALSLSQRARRFLRRVFIFFARERDASQLKAKGGRPCVPAAAAAAAGRGAKRPR